MGNSSTMSEVKLGEPTDSKAAIFFLNFIHPARGCSEHVLFQHSPTTICVQITYSPKSTVSSYWPLTAPLERFTVSALLKGTSTVCFKEEKAFFMNFMKLSEVTASNSTNYSTTPLYSFSFTPPLSYTWSWPEGIRDNDSWARTHSKSGIFWRLLLDF